MRWLLLIFVLVLSCNGPDATDAAVCRDYVQRICEPDLCDAVVPLVTSVDTCQAQMLKKSGCDNDNFKFTDPDRATFLNCRLPILAAGDNVNQHPNCDDVTTSFEQCPNVLAMFNPDGGT